MPVYRVWNFARTEKKCVVAGSLEDIVDKGKVKLGLNGPEISVNIEEDGTVIDDDDVLAELVGTTLMLLDEGQKWTPRGDCETVSNPTPVSTTNPPEIPSSVDVENSNEGSCSMANSCKDRARVSDLELPRFSSLVQQHLENGTPHEVWSRLVSETASFFIESKPFRLESSNDYQLLGKKMHARYPSIEMEGTRPWSLFTTNVSQRIRHMRWRKNKKSSSTPGASTSSTSTASLPKRRCRQMPDTRIPEDEYNTHMAQLCEEWKKPAVKRNESHIKSLLRETHVNRQQWIKGLPDSKIGPILEKVPCFEDATYLIYDFRLNLGVEVFTVMKKSMAVFVKALEMMREQSEEGPGKVFSLLQYVETSTAFERGRGKKTCPVIVVKEDVTDDNIEKALETAAYSPPHIISFRSDGVFKGAYVVGDSIVVDCKTNNVGVALLALLAAYYVFDLDYPRIYSQVLGICQTYIIKTVPYDGIKSKSYCMFSTKLKKAIEECEKADA